MRWLRFAVVVAIVTFIQASSVLDWVALSRIGVKPDLLLILMVFFAINAEGYEALIASFALGLAADVISPTFGPYIISFGLCGSLLSNMRRFITIKKTMHLVAAVFFSGIAIGVVAGVLMRFKGQGASQTFVHAFGMAAYSAVIAPYFFALLDIMSNWMGLKRYHGSR